MGWIAGASDSVLALECSARRRQHLRSNPRSIEPVNLAAGHRLLRAQDYHRRDQVSHFSSFSLCSAGRDLGSFRFELSALEQHLRFYATCLRACLGPRVPLRITVTGFEPNARHQLVAIRLLPKLQSEFTALDCAIDDQRSTGKGYYVDLCSGSLPRPNPARDANSSMAGPRPGLGNC